MPYNFVCNDCEVWFPSVRLVVFSKDLVCIGRLGVAGHVDDGSIVSLVVSDIAQDFDIEQGGVS